MWQNPGSLKALLNSLAKSREQFLLAMTFCYGDVADAAIVLRAHIALMRRCRPSAGGNEFAEWRRIAFSIRNFYINKVNDRCSAYVLSVSSLDSNHCLLQTAFNPLVMQTGFKF